ncbi:MAG: hypothetical protein P1U77_04615, partial [Rubripirellula sp.]|nr:hypothetical protein [Rubripirellula sp.]
QSVRKSVSPEVSQSGSQSVRKSVSPEVSQSGSQSVRKSVSPEVSQRAAGQILDPLQHWPAKTGRRRLDGEDWPHQTGK